MFSNLRDRLARVVKNLRGQGRLTEENITETLREIRIALLTADVAVSITENFISRIKTKALGQEVMTSLTPGDVLVKLVHDELVTLMGTEESSLNLRANPPVVILVAGLQGSGKTTTVAKLAKWLRETQKKSVMVASTDIYRPAAIDQLQRLATLTSVQFFPSNPSQKPVDIAKQAVSAAKAKVVDVLLIDTAGRLHIDAEMMTEIKAIHAAISPQETLFVVDSMTGQGAANTAKAFHEALPLTGVILTKTDGDARGGAALSIRAITDKPIKFLGIGEKIDALEAFDANRIASRILDMGDIVALVEAAEKNLDKKKASAFMKKINKGKVFDLEDFKEQLKQVKKMGGIMGIMSKLPGAGQLPSGLKNQFSDEKFKQIEAIINSMTIKERRYPDLLRSSRKIRIAKGSGTNIQAVNQMLRQFQQMQKMMRQMNKQGGMMKMMRNLRGKMPFGMGGMGGMPELPMMPKEPFEQD